MRSQTELGRTNPLKSGLFRLVTHGRPLSVLTGITRSVPVPCTDVPMCIIFFTNPLLMDAKLISVFCCLDQPDILIDFNIEDQERLPSKRLPVCHGAPEEGARHTVGATPGRAGPVWRPGRGGAMGQSLLGFLQGGWRDRVSRPGIGWSE